MTRARKQYRILVAGLGNELLMDDGVGVHAVRRLAESPEFKPGRSARAVEVGAAVLDALHLLEWADHILVIDAMRAGGPPGTLYLSSGDIEEGMEHGGLHELNVFAALRMIPGHHVQHIRVLGVEPASIDYGMELSPVLQAALPRVVEEALNLVRAWMQGTDRTEAAAL